MAKGQKSFSDKLKKDKGQAEKRQVRVVKSVKDPATGAVKFSDRMEAVPAEGMDNYLSKLVQKEG